MSGSANGSVVAWDIETSNVLGRVSLDGQPVVSPEFLPDGRVLIVAWGNDPVVYVWDPRPDRAVEFACAAAGRDLTAAEWRENFGDGPYRRTCPQE